METQRYSFGKVDPRPYFFKRKIETKSQIIWHQKLVHELEEKNIKKMGRVQKLPHGEMLWFGWLEDDLANSGLEEIFTVT